MTLITGVERRRRWSSEERAQILAAIDEPGAVVADVARRADVCTSLVYKWRREARNAVNGPHFFFAGNRGTDTVAVTGEWTRA
jgi:transposase